MTGTKGHSGRIRRATARFRGETWVRLSMLNDVTVNGHRLALKEYMMGEFWTVDGKRFDTASAAAAEFVRRVNGDQS